jgi:hypothetical protein
MDVSGQLRAPAALPPGKEPPVPIGQEAECAPESVWTLWRRENSCSYMGPTIASIRLKVLCALTGFPPAAAASSPRAFCVAGRPTCGARRNCPAEPLPQHPNPGRGLIAAVCNSSKSKAAFVFKHFVNYTKLHEKLHSPGALQ